MDYITEKEITVSKDDVYVVLLNRFLTTLTDDVNEAMYHGWVPQGGVCVCFEDSQHVFAQAMIRKQEEDIEC